MRRRREHGARLDISVEGFWGHRYQRIFYVQVEFCPLSMCLYLFRQKTIRIIKKELKVKKKKITNERLLEELLGEI